MISGVLQAPADTDCGTNQDVALPVTFDFHDNDGVGATACGADGTIVGPAFAGRSLFDDIP